LTEETKSTFIAEDAASEQENKSLRKNELVNSGGREAAEQVNRRPTDGSAAPRIERQGRNPCSRRCHPWAVPRQTRYEISIDHLILRNDKDVG
jgi:hypothetical protein